MRGPYASSPYIYVCQECWGRPYLFFPDKDYGGPTKTVNESATRNEVATRRNTHFINRPQELLIHKEVGAMANERFLEVPAIRGNMKGLDTYSAKMKSRFLGQVRNTGTQQSNFTKVFATFYDQSGKVIYVDFTYTSPSDIPPGQVYGFKVTGPNSPIASHVATYSLAAESNQYTSVPEFPWPGILLVAALSLGCVGLRKKRA